MNNHIPDFTPHIPSDAALASSVLPDKAIQLSTVSAQLTGRIPTTTRETITRHMAVINSYYSNLIEGNNTLFAPPKWVSYQLTWPNETCNLNP